MKEIRAYIRPFKLEPLTMKLFEIPGFPGMSCTKCRGIGTERKNQSSYEEHFDLFYDGLRIEIFAPDDLVEGIVSVLAKEARTGLSGDGVIFILDVIEGIRISSGERSAELR